MSETNKKNRPESSELDEGRIIFLNGTSSSGKSSLAAQLLTFLHHYRIAALDQLSDYSDYLPPTPWQFPEVQKDIVSGFHHYIADLLAGRQRLVIDHVLQEPEWAEECCEVLSDYDVMMVGVKCPKNILLDRERARPEREGNVEYQFPRVHVARKYDLVLDTSRLSPHDCAERIVLYMRENDTSTIATRKKFFDS